MGDEGSSTPLSDLRVMDLSTYVAGPSSTMLLAQLGAEVIRVDPIGGASDTRRAPLSPEGRSLYWASLNRGKLSVELDLRQEAGRQALTSLIRSSGASGGIVVTNAGPHAGLSYEELSKARPDLILVRITGYPDGAPAVDYTVNAAVGMPLLTGPADSFAAVNHVLPAWDLLAGVHVALAILAAERERSRTGRGSDIRIALSDVATTALANLGYVAESRINRQVRPRDGNFVYGTFGCDFATADGGRVMVVALTPRHWRGLVEMTGTDAILSAASGALGVDFGEEHERYEHRRLIRGVLEDWFRFRSTADVRCELDRHGVLWGAYRTVDEFINAPDGFVARSDLFDEVDYPGIGAILTARAPFRGLGGPARPAPVPGQDTVRVMQTMLDPDGPTLNELRERGVIGAPVDLDTTRRRTGRIGSQGGTL